MLRSQLHFVLVALFASVLLVRASSIPPRERLAELLSSELPQGKEDFSRMLLIKLLSSLMKSENAVVDDSEEDPIVREESTRQLPSSQRERKAGCKNFFWKTFTSC
ncbi:somatostatin-1 [Polypterus senegalus]